jgi:hypothetical protein
MMLLKTSLTVPKKGPLTVYIRVRVITATITATPVAIAAQPTTDGEKVLVVIITHKVDCHMNKVCTADGL